MILKRKLKMCMIKNFVIELDCCKKLCCWKSLIFEWVRMLLIWLKCLKVIVRFRVIGVKWCWKRYWKCLGCKRVGNIKFRVVIVMKMVRGWDLMWLFICLKINRWWLIWRCYWCCGNVLFWCRMKSRVGICRFMLNL